MVLGRGRYIPLPVSRRVCVLVSRSDFCCVVINGVPPPTTMTITSPRTPGSVHNEEAQFVLGNESLIQIVVSYRADGVVLAPDRGQTDWRRRRRR